MRPVSKMVTVLLVKVSGAPELPLGVAVRV